METRWGERGTCPRCGSGEVTHVVFGMPGPDAFDTAPAWVRFAGCTIMRRPAQRVCEECGHEWDRLGPPTGVGEPRRRR